MEKQETLLERLARKNNITVEEMYKQLRKKIEAGLNDPDPKCRAQWEKIPHAKENITVEEWLEYVVKKLHEESKEEMFRTYLK